MAQTAEGGGLCKSEEYSAEDDEECQAEKKGNFYRLQVCFGSLHRSAVDIDPEGLHQVIKFSNRLHKSSHSLRRLIFTKFQIDFNSHRIFAPGFMRECPKNASDKEMLDWIDHKMVEPAI